MVSDSTDTLRVVCEQVSRIFQASPDFTSSIIVCKVLCQPLLIDHQNYYGALVDRYIQQFCITALSMDEEHIILVKCTADLRWDQLVDVIAQKPDPQALIFSNIDKLSRYLQAMVLGLLKTRKLSHNGETMILDTRVLVIGTFQKMEPTPTSRLIRHLSDHFLLMHSLDDEGDLKHAVKDGAKDLLSPLTEDYFQKVLRDVSKVRLIAEIRRYMQDIVVFLRTHRLVRSGVSPQAVKGFENLLKTLCVLHGYNFGTPSLVILAARIKFPLNLALCSPEDEPSIAYGGDVHLIGSWMKKWDADLVIEDVLEKVPAPQ